MRWWTFWNAVVHLGRETDLGIKQQATFQLRIERHQDTDSCQNISAVTKAGEARVDGSGREVEGSEEKMHVSLPQA